MHRISLQMTREIITWLSEQRYNKKKVRGGHIKIYKTFLQLFFLFYQPRQTICAMR